MAKPKTSKNKTAKKGKRKLSSWNLFVMKVKKMNPSLLIKSWKKYITEVLKMASTLKKKGKMN